MRPSQFSGILERVRGEDNEQLVNEVVLRSQGEAEYNPDNIGHFGLNLRRYAHFTSPIRRYADLIVHRALIASLGLGPGGLTASEEARLEEIAGLISRTERRAMAAERDTVDRLIAGFLAERVDETFDARISGVTKSGLFVQLPQYGADGFIPVSSLGDDYYHFDEAARSLFGERTGKGYQLADRVEVRLVEIAPLAGAMRFEMLTEPKPLPGSKRWNHKAKGQRTRARASQPRRGPRGREMTMKEQVFGGGRSRAARQARPLWQSIKRGLFCKCPNCGEGRLFASFLKTVDRCEVCGEEIFHHRADDLPAYLVVVIVGHIVVGAFMGVEATVTLSTWQHLAIWVPLTIVSALALLRPTKGAVVGMQWALYMHGFGEDDAIEGHPEA